MPVGRPDPATIRRRWPIAEGGLDVDTIKRILKPKPAVAPIAAVRRAQDQGRRASVPSRPSRGNRSESSGPEESPVSASRSGMIERLALAAGRLLDAVGPGLPGVAVPRFERQEIIGVAHEVAILVRQVPAGLSGPTETIRHQRAASATVSRLPRTASQNASALSAGTPSAASRSFASANGIWWISARLSTVSSAGSNFDADFEVPAGSKRAASSSIDGHRRHAFGRADQHGQRSHGHRLDAGFGKAGDRQRAAALRQPLARRRGQQIVVAEGRRLGAERLEQRDLHAGIGDMIVAADDMRDAELDVVDHRRQRVEIAAVLAHQHRIGDGGEIDRFGAAHEIVPMDVGALAARTGRRRNWAAGSASAACGRPPRSAAFSAAPSFSASRP